MMKLKHILTIQLNMLMLLCCGLSHAQQSSISIQDNQSSKPIEGVSVRLSSLVTSDSKTLISDSEGRIVWSGMTFPVLVTMYHLSYQSISHEISSAGKYQFELVEQTSLLDDIIISANRQQNQSIDQELFVVEQIGRQSIDQLSGNNLSDVLNFSQNITILPEASTGRKTISMFGLSGEYVKVLIDNIPMTGDNGAGNDIDIAQINLDNVERIEVSPGSMGVLYGSNAVAGVVNIVTQKKFDAKLSIRAFVQEESNGSEYNWTDEGRHIQGVNVSTKLNPNLSISLGANRNDYKGFKNTYKGKDYYGANGTRGYQWNPKEQLNLNAGIHYNIGKKTHLHYKYEYYTESLFIHDTTLIGGVGIDGLPVYKANDEQFVTRRHVNNLNLSSRIHTWPVSLLLSYQKQERLEEEYVYDLEYQVKTSTSGMNLNQSSDYIFSKGMIEEIFGRTEWYKLTAGYELDHQKGYDAIASGTYSDSVTNQSLTNTDLFFQNYITLRSKLTIAPGLRINHNSLYGNYGVWGISTHVDFTQAIKSHLAIGSAYKTPNFNQLYRYFVDANHDVTGNPDLLPEDGVSVVWQTSLTKNIQNLLLKSELSVFLFDIRNKIGLTTITEQDPNTTTEIQRSTYLNLDQYQSVGLSARQMVDFNKLMVQLDASYTGVRQSIPGETYDNTYLFTFTSNSSLTYRIGKKIDLSAYLKYNGRSERYFQTEDGNAYKALVDAYTLMDMNVSKSFFKNTIKLNLGVRNLLDIVNVDASGVPAQTAHSSSSPSSLMFASGRSYLAKLTYSFKK